MNFDRARTILERAENQGRRTRLGEGLSAGAIAEQARLYLKRWATG